MMRSDGNYTPFCSVVIPTYDRAEQLEMALRSLGEQGYRNFETIIVDNSAGDERARMLAERWSARLLVESRRGVSFARNRGADEARGEIIAFLDDDSVADPHWLSAIVAEFRDPSIAVVSGPYLPLYPAPYGGLYNLGDARLVVDRTIPGWFEFSAFASPARGGNMALRASVVRLWPGFEAELGRGTLLRAFPDTEVPACGSDDCYAVLQLVEQGAKFVYTPDARVRHPFPRTLDELRAFHIRNLTGCGMYAGFLLARGYWGGVLKYMLRRVMGYRFRTAQPEAYPLEIGRVGELLAGLKGLFLFARIQLAWKIGGSQNYSASMRGDATIARHGA